MLPVGTKASPAIDVPCATCVWVGISPMVSVCAGSPPRSPRVWAPPSWIGVRPCRLGSAKVWRPSPPYVVPSRENSAWFWLIGRSCPLQKAHPLGGNENDTILISDRNGSDIALPLVCTTCRCADL